MVTPLTQLGTTDIAFPPLGVGTWQWGDRAVWEYSEADSTADIVTAFWQSLGSGLRFFDTAELYGRGTSERLVGRLARSTDQQLVLASKFFPFPWRLGPRTLLDALDHTLARMGVEQIDLYQVHFPSPLLPIDGLMDAMAEAVASGKIRAVGVSNFNAEQMRAAHTALARHGIPLASNQVEYSLLQRTPETNGVYAACQELGVTLIAYSPLAQGLLGGKYRPGVRPGGVRRWTPAFRDTNLARLEPVIQLLQELGTTHGGKTPAQVALNWLIGRGTVPIPGAKNARQAAQNAGALGWALDGDDMARLDAATANWRA